MLAHTTTRTTPSTAVIAKHPDVSCLARLALWIISVLSGPLHQGRATEDFVYHLSRTDKGAANCSSLEQKTTYDNHNTPNEGG